MESLQTLRSLPALLARRRRLNALASAVRALGLVAGLHFLFLAALTCVSLRYPLSARCLAAMAWSYLVYLIPPALFLGRVYAPENSSEAAARELDRANPSAPDPFRTVLSLRNHGEETLRQLDAMLSPWLPRLVFPRPDWLPRLQRALLAAGALALAACAVFSGRPGEFARRASLPWLALERLPILRFDLEEAKPVLGAGDTAVVRGKVRNLIAGQTVFAYVRNAGGESRFPLDMKADAGSASGIDPSFAFRYGPAESDFTVTFAGDNGQSPSLRYRVVPAPFLERVQAVLTPPAYTRRPADTLPLGVTRFPVLPGTRVTWLMEADRDLQRMAWKFSPADGSAASGVASQAASDTTPRSKPTVTSVVRPSEDTLGPGRSFQVAREIRAPMDYSFWLEDRDGIRSRPSLPARVDLIPDLPPEIDLVSPSADTLLDRDAKIDLAFRVKDDYGVTSLKLVWRVTADGKPRGEGSRDCRDWLREARAGLAEAEWDLRALDLRPGNTVEFHLAATDNDTVNGPKTGRSATRVLRMPGLEEVLAVSRRQDQSATADLKSALQREKQLERKLEREQEPNHDEAPPMLADYEINRIMVEDPRENLRRTQAALAQMQQALDRQSKQGGEGGNDKSGKNAKETIQAQTATRELQDMLKKSEPALPRGNQNMLPEEDRRKNLDDLMKAQQEQADKLTALRDKLDKQTPKAPDARFDMAKMQLENLAKELDKNRQNQNDLSKLFRDQAAQAKAKSDLMDQAIQEQMRMAQDMKGANDDLQKAMDQGKKNGLLSPELLEKIKKVQDLLHEVLPDSLQRLMESKLQGQDVNEQELREKLQQMLDRQAELSENLSRALAMLEQLKDKKRMQELKQALSELQTREQALQKQIEAGKTGPAQDAEQKAIQQETQKALSDFSNQAAGKPDLQDMSKHLQAGPVQKDMQDVRQALANAGKSKSKSEQGSSAAKAAKSASSAASKLGDMQSMLGEAMQGMDNSIDVGEAQEILQESLALSRLQMMIRDGSARRESEGWEGDEASLYADVAQTAQWLNERVKALAAKVPFLGDALTAESRDFAAAARETAHAYTWNSGDKALQHNQNLSRELLKLLKMAQSGGQGGSSGSSGSSAGNSGQSGQGEGDLAGQLKGMSGKQMAINQATYQLLQAMMEGRQLGPNSGGKGRNGQGQSGGQNGQDGQDGNGGQGEGQDGQGGRGGMANQEGELGEKLESMAEGLKEEGGSAQKLRGLADEARRLEDDLRSGRLSPEEVRRRQERFQSRLLEASNAMQERGQSEARQGETAKGRGTEVTEGKAPDEARLLQLLREARRESKGMRLSEGQRKYLDEYYESLLTR